ncbi:MAG TPA: HAMP domain-containing sensor histidine kinase [Verrucomicrobiaceae bacterium]|jgi:K+-sensing histidine kinase KdpD
MTAHLRPASTRPPGVPPTESKTTEELAREIERLRGDLLTISRRICHDLRSPISGILTAGELAAELLAEKVPSAAELTQPIFRSVEALTRLIERLSLITRASVHPVVKTSVSMKEVVQRARQRFEAMLYKKDVIIAEPEVWPEVEGVESWLEVIWWNLLANALEHAGDPARVELGWAQQDREFQFWVCDNGGGVPKEKCSRLFQPFDSLHQPNAARGLGLPIVQRLVNLQSGHCGYEPRSQGGSRFFFTLPVTEDRFKHPPQVS